MCSRFTKFSRRQINDDGDDDDVKTKRLPTLCRRVSSRIGLHNDWSSVDDLSSMTIRCAAKTRAQRK